MGEHNLGYTRLLAGDLAAALVDMDRARAVLAPLSSVNAAMGDQDRAEVLMAAGLVAEGRAALAAAARAYGAAPAGAPPGRGRAHPGPLAAVRRTRPRRRPWPGGRRAGSSAAEAAALAARAEAAGLQAEVDAGRTSPRLLDEGERLAAELRRRRACAWHATARAAARRAGPAQAGPGRRGAARCRPAATCRRRPRSPFACWPATCAPSSPRPQARRSGAPALRAGLDDLHDWQSSFGSLDLQTNVVGHGVRLAVRGLSLAVASAVGRVLFEWSERARMLASRIQPVRAPQDPPTVADLAELRAEPTPEREAELRRRVRERAWQHRGSGEVTDPVSARRPAGGAGRRRRAGGVRRDRRPGRRTGRHLDRVDPVTTSASGTGSTPRSAACSPTSTWRRPTCPARWPGSVRGDAGATARRRWRLLVAPLLDASVDRPGGAHPVRAAGRGPVDAAARVWPADR